MLYTLSKPNLSIQGEITLTGSKSIANRALIIRALCTEDFPIHALAASKDTVTLNQLLTDHKSNPTAELTLDTGAAGTTFRFMTAYLALQNETQILTGSERMKQRPIGVLVEALNQLGADIEYLENTGYPPLKIKSPQSAASWQSELTISAGTSSQYISALLMIAPTLPNGLKLTLDGEVVSRPYIEMTLNLMQYFGVNHVWEGQTISVAPQAYQAKEFTVEADWSAASYHYALAAFATDDLDLQLNGLQENSVQGDSVLAEMMTAFSVKTTFNETGVRLTKSDTPTAPIFECDFIKCPDIAQTLAVICGGLGVQGLFTGLQTLSIKETDRIAALQNELNKVNVFFNKLPTKFSKKSGKEYYMVEGKASFPEVPTFATYEDHRMAMAFAPLAMLDTIKIEEPMVVVKSYPAFYEDFEGLGFVVVKEEEEKDVRVCY
ncbi:MAG: 3-phosphoshikimate 1-carboxyvinyltransferase [Saprospiraceae bacterium]